MRSTYWNELIHKAQRISWVLFLVAIPVTSFPYFPGGLGGKTLVRPLAIYPLIVLLLIATLPRLYTRPLPITFLPLFTFIVVAMASSMLALTNSKEVFKGVTMAERLLRNIITLGVGAGFYLTVALFHRNWEDLKFTLRWLYAGFTVALLWGSLQTVYVIYYSSPYFEFISNIQAHLSIRRLFQTRISGMTYEPKWFAEQISFLLLPWLLGSVITNRTVFKWRYRWLTLEWFLLLWAIVVLLFTFSRSGLFLLVVLIFMSVFFARVAWKKEAVSSKIKSTARKRFRLLEVALVMVTLGAVTFVLGSRNPYFSRLWRYWVIDETAAKSYFEFIAATQRFAYWETAFRIYEAHPIFGVGLGNFAFFFDEMLPDRPWNRQPEIIRQIIPTEGGDQLITPKNLYARLLSETGLVGSITFTAFIIAVLGCALYLWYSSSSEGKFWGFSGMLGMVAFTMVGLSSDSFAIPNMWVVFGLITAAAHINAPSQSPGPDIDQSLPNGGWVVSEEMS